ncbi:MAG TPA: hypothetical protein VFQ85_16195 [Mycobacteriales bacterium]|nr:hypothetical protein [Mycobacteriales bacterium]
MPTPFTRAAVAAAAVLACAFPAVPAAAATPPPGAVAEGIAVDVHTLFSPQEDITQARATQEGPSTAPAVAAVAGPVSAGPLGAVTALTSLAHTTAAPSAEATAGVSDLELNDLAGAPVVSAKLIGVTARAGCTEAPSATLAAVDLLVAGTPVDAATVPPNTELAPQVFNPLGLKAVLNEQHPAADGRGIVVNALHVFQVGALPLPDAFALFGDATVAHARGGVACPNGAGSTGAGNDVAFHDDVAPAVAKPGATVTYDARLALGEHASGSCLVSRFLVHLPAGFDYVSTSGPFGTDASTTTRPGGGTDVEIRSPLPPALVDDTVTQQVVATVGPDTAPGTYYEDVEVWCAVHGNWVKGLNTAVTVPPPVTPPPTTPPPTPRVTPPATPPATAPPAPPDRDATMPKTGAPGALGGVACALLAGAYALRRRNAC